MGFWELDCGKTCNCFPRVNLYVHSVLTIAPEECERVSSPCRASLYVLRGATPAPSAAEFYQQFLHTFTAASSASRLIHPNPITIYAGDDLSDEVL
ncbi:unnamed protein product [Toxocara canis]|uniref:Alpha/beta-Hydrolases superfamily protein n=1 Tax=Toxocara canis TaxID=6265 RepID=A0A183TUY3_TOXCA|nr:unnamed protein product [Toxocara canis]